MALRRERRWAALGDLHMHKYINCYCYHIATSIITIDYCINHYYILVRVRSLRHPREAGGQDSAKGGAAETGCGDLYDVIDCFNYIILPPSTAPPSNCTPPVMNTQWPSRRKAGPRGFLRGIITPFLCYSFFILRVIVISLSLYIYIYIYIYLYPYISIYIYIYTYTHIYIYIYISRRGPGLDALPPAGNTYYTIL